jgi:hypothetical protein
MMCFFDMKCICSVLEVQVLERILLGTVMAFEEYPGFKNENDLYHGSREPDRLKVIRRIG